MRLTELRWAKGKYLLSSYFMPSIVPGTSYTLSYLVSLIPDWKIVSSYCYRGKERHVVSLHAAAAAKSLQSCPTLCDPIDGSLLGSPIPGILQARTLEWVAISFSNAWKWKVKVKLLSRVRLLATPWTTAYQAPPSMGFARQEYWSGVPLPSPVSLHSYIIIKILATLTSELITHLLV